MNEQLPASIAKTVAKLRSTGDLNTAALIELAYRIGYVDGQIAAAAAVSAKLKESA